MCEQRRPSEEDRGIPSGNAWKSDACSKTAEEQKGLPGRAACAKALRQVDDELCWGNANPSLLRGPERGGPSLESEAEARPQRFSDGTRRG